ncbi:MAG: hypothetical protein EPN37_02595 [Chitinophagaceae bacterium]|nr:MAG: hypothetical protein EPN37_02595 [Chitinophagaceae bacterium]
MKRLSLKALNLSGSEVLTREQLKKVLGGGSFVQQTTYAACAGSSSETWYCCTSGGSNLGAMSSTDCNTAMTQCLNAGGNGLVGGMGASCPA